MDIDAVLNKVGLWHIPVFGFVMFRSFQLAFNLLFLTFAAPAKHDHWCARPAHLFDIFTSNQWKSQAIPVQNGQLSKCLVYKYVESIDGHVSFSNETESCNRWDFDDTYFGKTLVSEFNLVCDRSWYVSTSQALLMVGTFIGNVIFAKLADRRGRRCSLLWATLLMISGELVAMCCHDFWTFSAVRVFIAAAIGGYQNTVMACLVESLSSRKRSFIVLTTLNWTVGKIILPWISYFFRDWRHQLIVYTLFIVPNLILWFFVPESPRWLLATRRFSAAEKELSNVVRKNKLKNIDIVEVVEQQRKQSKNDQSKKAVGYSDLFRGRQIRIRMICISIMFVVNRLLMYHLTFFSARMGGNPFVAFSLSSLLTIPSDIVAAFCVRYFKRQPLVFLTFTLTAVLNLLFIPFGEEYVVLRIVICTLALNVNLLNASSLNVFVTESLPTVVRAMGVATAYMVSRLGAVIAPFLKELSDFGGPWLSCAVACSFALAGAVASMFLAETFQKSLPESLADIDPELYGRVETRESETEKSTK